MMLDTRGLHMPAAFFADNRAQLLARLPERCFVLLYAGKAKVMTRDTHYRFVPNRNFYYLTGVDQEESTLVIHKDKQNCHSILYICPNDPLRERWTGQRISAQEAKERSNVDEVRFLPSLADKLHELAQDKCLVPALDSETKQTFSKPFIESLEAQGHAHIIDISPMLTTMRTRKQPCEIEMIKCAVSVCEEVLLQVAPLFQKETTELEIFAAIDYELMHRGCLLPAFPTIVAGDKNVFYLHHPEPSSVLLEKGMLVQIDFGAIVGGLCSDISRVFPVGGVFTKKQKKLYSIVRSCQEKAFSVIKPGVTIAQINSEVRTLATALLLEAHVMTQEEDVGNYVWHNTTHHLGMDVHDVSDREKPLEVGAVLAVEPGIYIPQWGIGFRIEDDIEVRDSGCVLLSEHILREAEDIERMVMGKED